MKLKNGQISILFNDDGLRIEVHDDPSGITFARIKLTPKQTMQAMSRLSNTHCEIEVFGLESVGKKLEHKKFEFKVGGSLYKRPSEKILFALVDAACPEGWTASHYFGSQDSFFDKDGEMWARTTIRRWV